MAFVSGVEISIEWEGTQIHVVGLNFDPGNGALNDGLASIRAGRVERARRMADELARIGIANTCRSAPRRFSHHRRTCAASPARCWTRWSARGT